MAEAHSKYSASNFEADALCPGRPVMQRGKPDSSSEYADEGTAAHQVLTWALQQERPAAAYRGRRVAVGMRTFEVDDDMVQAVQTALDSIAEITGGAPVLADQRVNYASALGVPEGEGWGTLDVAAPVGTELQVFDYKHGRGVEVDAADEFGGPNPQMALYALGTLATLDELMGPFETVRLVILQPRIKSAPSEHTLTVDELHAWAATVARGAVAQRVRAEQYVGDPDWVEDYLSPNEKSCKFCKAKATCPALRNEVAQTVFERAPASPDEFIDAIPSGAGYATDAEWLAAALLKADAIEGWCSAVRAEVERRLLAGDEVPGFKLVEGRAGHRAWADADEAEQALKRARLRTEQMYDMKLISPTTAEKLAKAGDLGPRVWKALQSRITQPKGKPHVAPLADKRPALDIKPVSEEFPTLVADAATDLA